MEVAAEPGAGASMDSLPTQVGARAPTLPADAAGYEVSNDLVDGDDPRLPAARDFAFAHKLSQAGFEQLLEMGVKMKEAKQAAVDDAVAFEAAKLGPQGKERFGAVRAWLGSTLSEEHSSAILGMLYKAEHVEAMEKLMRLLKPVYPGTSRANVQLSDEEYERMTFVQRMQYAYQHSRKKRR